MDEYRNDIGDGEGFVRMTVAIAVSAFHGAHFSSMHARDSSLDCNKSWYFSAVIQSSVSADWITRFN